LPIFHKKQRFNSHHGAQNCLRFADGVAALQIIHVINVKDGVNMGNKPAYQANDVINSGSALGRPGGRFYQNSLTQQN